MKKMLAFIFIFTLYSNTTEARVECFGNWFGEMYCLETTPFSAVNNTPNLIIDMNVGDTAEARLTITTTVLNQSFLGGTNLSVGMLNNRNVTIECIQDCTHTITAVGQVINPLFRIKVRVPQDATIPLTIHAGVSVGANAGLTYVEASARGFSSTINLQIINSARFKVTPPSPVTVAGARKFYGLNVNWTAVTGAHEYNVYFRNDTAPLYSGTSTSFSDTRDLRCSRSQSSVNHIYSVEAVSSEGYASTLAQGSFNYRCTLR